MLVFEKARELGELILTTEQAVKRDDAMEAYLKDSEAVSKMREYESFQREIQQKMQSDDFSQEEFNESAESLRKMGTELKAHPVVGPYIEASNSFNMMVNQIFGIIQKTVTGDEAACGSCDDSCDCTSGDCGCGGC